MPADLHEATRFEDRHTRRDVLGLAALWSAVGALVMALLGAMRLPMPAVFPESDARIKLGDPRQFAVGSSTYFPKQRLWLFHAEQGFHAMSAVCTHLGCVVEREGGGEFKCPCHGSKFDVRGAITAGPAPKGLAWVELSLSPEGRLIADTLKEVPAGTVFRVS